MNNDLISREVLNKALHNFFDGKVIDEPAYILRDVLSIIDSSPAVAVIPNEEGYEMYGKGYLQGYERGKNERSQGEWIGDTDLDNTCKCSKCRMTFDTDRLKMVMCDGKYELPPCCPNCGAEMRKCGAE